VYLVYESTIDQTMAATVILVFLSLFVLITGILFRLLHCSGLITLQVMLHNDVHITF